MALVSETHAPSCSIAGARLVMNFAMYSGVRVWPYAFTSSCSMPAHLSTQRVHAELAEGGRAWKVTDMVVVRARLEVSRDLNNRSIPKSRNTRQFTLRDGTITLRFL